MVADGPGGGRNRLVNRIILRNNATLSRYPSVITRTYRMLGGRHGAPMSGLAAPTRSYRREPTRGACSGIGKEAFDIAPRETVG